MGGFTDVNEVNDELFILDLKASWDLSSEGVAPFRTVKFKGDTKSIGTHLGLIKHNDEAIYFLHSRSHLTVMRVDIGSNHVHRVAQLPDANRNRLGRLYHYLIRSDVDLDEYLIVDAVLVRGSYPRIINRVYSFDRKTNRHRAHPALDEDVKLFQWFVYQGVLHALILSNSQGHRFSNGTLFTFDPATSSWGTRGTKLVEPFNNSIGQSVRVGSRLYVYSGHNEQAGFSVSRDFVYILDMATLAWSRERPGPDFETRTRSCSVHYNGFLVNSFGIVRGKTRTNTTQIIDTLTWSQARSLTRASKNSASLVSEQSLGNYGLGAFDFALIALGILALGGILIFLVKIYTYNPFRSDISPPEFFLESEPYAV